MSLLTGQNPIFRDPALAVMGLLPARYSGNIVDARNPSCLSWRAAWITRLAEVASGSGCGAGFGGGASRTISMLPSTIPSISVRRLSRYSSSSIAPRANPAASALSWDLFIGVGGFATR